MDNRVLATNLVRVRHDRGKSQEAVAEAAGLSRAAYRAIEKGRSAPRVESLRAIAGALGVPVRDLVTPVRRLQRVRFRSLKRLKSRDQVLASVSCWLQDWNELEELLGDRIPHRLGPLCEAVQGARGTGIPAVAALARSHFGLNEREPVHDVCGLLESVGVKVFAVQVATDAFLGLSVAEEDGGPAVVVNTWDRLAVEHWIFSAVHELGHLLLHLASFDVFAEDEDEDQEREAEAFASHFLMPDGVFRREWADAAGLAFLDRVLKVKRVFRVSWRTVLFRVAERLPKDERPALWSRMNFEYQRRHGRPLLKLAEPEASPAGVFRAPRPSALAGAEPASLDEHDFQGDRLARMVRQAVEGDVITLSRAAEILGLSLNGMRERWASWVG
ncbi:helix-turn-helix domain-containing protein [Myxococcota bacterium]|nr:helix-turn-helix domain-containing protein [Myxococcota bacterium]